MQLKRWDTREVIFELECNSWEELLKGALLDEKVSFLRADFRGADFRCADFRDFDFSYRHFFEVDLTDASFIASNFRNCNFCYCDFARSNFKNCNFCYCDFGNSNFSHSNFNYCDFGNVEFRKANFTDASFHCSEHQFKIGNMKEWHSMQLETYFIGFNEKTLCISSKQYPVKRWKNFSDEEISGMGNGALEWWKKWKDFIFKAIELCYVDEKKRS